MSKNPKARAAWLKTQYALDHHARSLAPIARVGLFSERDAIRWVENL